MPKDQTTVNRRVLESWRARACAAGLCVGAQIFLFGTGIAMPLSLNSAWIAAILSLPFSALITIACRRKGFLYGYPSSRKALFLLALTLLLHAVFAAATLVNFAEHTLLEQAQILWIVLITAVAVFLCALSRGEGISWLCFALRWALPLLLFILILFSVPMKVPSGLFPLLGPGKTALGISTLCMLSASTPALMLLLPPPEIVQIHQEGLKTPAPKTGFFVWRVLAGAAAGTLVLFCACVCSTYESIAESMQWGARLRIVASDQPHEGIPQTLLTMLQATAIFLLCTNMLSAAEQALAGTTNKSSKSYTGLAALSLVLLALLLLLIACGFDIALFAAPLMIVPALLVLLLLKKEEATAS